MVQARFKSAVATLTGVPAPDVVAAFRILEEAYVSGGHAYHNLHHVKATLETAFRLSKDIEGENTARIILALIYHDVVYDPRSEENEGHSAAFARRELSKLGVAEDHLAEIERLILQTRDHKVPDGDRAGALVVDADLSILQSSSEAYDAYAAAIRKEYAHVPEDDYRAGRTRVLKGLMARRLFSSPLLAEERARANMRREIESLSN